MADKAAASKKSTNKNVSCTLPEDVFAILDEHKWQVRKNMSGMILLAVTEYLDNHGLRENAESAEPQGRPFAGSVPAPEPESPEKTVPVKGK